MKNKINLINIKNLIFDLGGVILNIDYQLTDKAFKDLGIKDFDKIYSKAVQIDLFDNLDKGLITPDEFYAKIKKLINIAITDADIYNAWKAMLLDFPKERIKLLENLKKHYRTFLLSNTNKIHYPVYTKDIQEQYGYNNLSELFEKAYFSFNLGIKKPDIEIFKLVITENNLKPEETLFIDDSPQHIEGAKKTGMNTYLLKDKEDIVYLNFSL